MRVWPDVKHLARANRAFLRRAVSALVADGIEQFLDLGAGIPTVGSVHETAWPANGRARTVYIDADLVAVAHGSALLAGDPRTAFVHADLRDPTAVLRDATATGLLNLSRPVAVLMLAVLPFVPDADDPASVVAGYRDATAPGSCLVLSHGTDDYRPEAAHRAEDVYRRAAQPMTLRSRSEITALLDGYELLEPGLVDMIHWRPDPDGGLPDPLDGDVARYSMLAAVGRKCMDTP